MGHRELYLFTSFRFSRVFRCSLGFGNHSGRASCATVVMRAVGIPGKGVVSPGDSFSSVYLCGFYQSLTLDQILRLVLEVKL